MDFLVYGMEISLAQPNVSLIELAFSSRGIVSVFYVNFYVLNNGQQNAFG